jgi:hypothetical protein
VNEFKDIFAPLNTHGSQVLAEIRSPKGSYLVVDSFVERLDSDLSNNAGRLGVKGLPRPSASTRTAIALRPPSRRASPTPPTSPPRSIRCPIGCGQARAPCCWARPAASGSTRRRDAGASAIEIVEPDTVLRGALVAGLGPVGPLDIANERRVLDTSPLALIRLERGGTFDVIDVTREFLAQSETNRAVLSVETLAACSAC